MKYKKWIGEEIQFVKENINRLNNIEIGKVLGRDRISIIAMISYYRIRRTGEAIREFQAEGGKNQGINNRREPEFKVILCELYPELGDCVICTSHCADSRGYPMIHRNGKPYRMKNYFWEQKYGKLPGGIYVLHKCDNTACVRLDHLFLGTQADNIWDGINKGRMPQLRVV